MTEKCPYRTWFAGVVTESMEMLGETKKIN